MQTKPARYLSPGLTNLDFDLSSASGCLLGPEMVFVSVVLDLCQNNFNESSAQHAKCLLLERVDA